MNNKIPDPDALFPNEYKTSCFIKNVITAPNVSVGDYTYYDDPVDPASFEKNNILFNWPEFGDKLVIGKFCSIASGTKFIMGPANHRLSSVTTYPFNVFGGAWAQHTPPHLAQLPFKGDIRVGNDVWLGQNVTVLPGSYLAREANGINPGKNRIRLALVAEPAECLEGILRIVEFVKTQRREL